MEVVGYGRSNQHQPNPKLRQSHAQFRIFIGRPLEILIKSADARKIDKALFSRISPPGPRANQENKD